MKYLFCALLLLNVLFGYGQAKVVLVDDIAAGPAFSNAHPFIICNNQLVFAASTPATSYELFYYTGFGKCNMVADLNPGTLPGVDPEQMAILSTDKDVLYFSGQLPYGNTELYQWDGLNTPSIVSDIFPGNTGSGPRYITALNGKIYFEAMQDIAHGRELCEYDPLTNTVTRLTDINPGNAGANIYNLTVYNGKLYFNAYNSVQADIYCYDPGNNSTFVVAGSNGLNLGGSHFLVANSKLYCVLSESNYGSELYEYDGVNPLHRVTDINPGQYYGVQGNLAFYNGKLYFFGNDGSKSADFLWQYDLATGVPLAVSSNHFSGGVGLAYKNKLYFTAKIPAIVGNQNWFCSYDGTSAPQIVDTSIQGAANFIEFNGDLYFTAYNANTGSELYRLSDNTSIQNISRIKNVVLLPNPATSEVQLAFVLTYSTDILLTITDITGRTVYTVNEKTYHAGKGKIELDMRSLPAGTYICRLQNEHDNTLWSGKMVKE